MGAADQQTWTETRSTGGALLNWREMWASRELVAFFALRDLKVRYKQAALGVVWVVVQPLVTVAALTLAFDRLTNVDTFGLPYPVFALAGLLGWTYVSQCVARGSEVLVATPALVNKVYIPRLTAPVASLVPGLIDLAVGLVLLAVTSIVFDVTPTVALLLLPAWVILLMVTAIGPVLILAALNVKYRDVRHMVPPLLQAMLFLSPVAYSSSGLEGAGKLFYSLNPAAGALEFGRYVLVGGAWPGWQLGVSLASSAALALVGLVYFQYSQRSFADVI
jgi:ABC-type polysaccharide/polyol phosphate export permease